MRKFVFWFQERIRSWIKPAMPVLIIDLLSDLTHSRMLCGPFISREFCDACMHDPPRFQFHHNKDIPCSK